MLPGTCLSMRSVEAISARWRPTTGIYCDDLLKIARMFYQLTATLRRAMPACFTSNVRVIINMVIVQGRVTLNLLSTEAIRVRSRSVVARRTLAVKRGRHTVGAGLSSGPVIV